MTGNSSSLESAGVGCLASPGSLSGNTGSEQHLLRSPGHTGSVALSIDFLSVYRRFEYLQTRMLVFVQNKIGELKQELGVTSKQQNISTLDVPPASTVNVVNTGPLMKETEQHEAFPGGIADESMTEYDKLSCYCHKHATPGEYCEPIPQGDRRRQVVEDCAWNSWSGIDWLGSG